MSAQLQQLEAGKWQLRGEVTFVNAAVVASITTWQQETRLTLDLAEAAGGSALLLVLLAWWRAAQKAEIALEFINLTPATRRLLELSDLEEILPLGE